MGLADSKDLQILAYPSRLVGRRINMPLTEQQSRRRRIVLIASGAISVGLLLAAVSVPFWDAGAGGLERGERARLAITRDRSTKPQPPSTEKSVAKTPRQPRDESRREPRFVGPPEKSTSTDVPIAVPLPPSLPSRMTQQAPPQPYPPLPRPAPPRGVPLDPPQRETTVDGTGVSLDTLKALFRRPALLRPARGRDAEEILLGARLFSEPKLSADHKMSCATCHDPAQSFADGRRKARGNKGQDLPRNTPQLWNLETARSFYWDGRSLSLEAQIKDAVEREGEMDATLEAAVVWLSRDTSYVAAFQRTYGGQNALNSDNLLKALAAYERTLVSPDTRFDRWIEGDMYALSEREIAGLRVFTGKGRCLACHGGWRFTDDGFHDIGLKSKDPGRQSIAGGPERAFKTPSLREAVWAAPYMHDGSLKTLEDVVEHYAGKLEDRPSLAPELKRGVTLTPTERADLITFLKTLSSDSRPKPPPLPSP
jgi:cytochrome c peroxidase